MRAKANYKHVILPPFRDHNDDYNDDNDFRHRCSHPTSILLIIPFWWPILTRLLLNMLPLLNVGGLPWQNHMASCKKRPPRSRQPTQVSGLGVVYDDFNEDGAQCKNSVRFLFCRFL